MIIGAFQITIFGFFMLVVCAFAIFFAIFSILYLAPFQIWLGIKKADKLYLDLEPKTLSDTFRCATILYISFLKKIKPVF